VSASSVPDRPSLSDNRPRVSQSEVHAARVSTSALSPSIKSGKNRLEERFGLKATVEQGPIVRKGHDSARRREACSNQAFAATLSCISRTTIVKTSISYFDCTSPAITAATLSSIWFQPSI
jgi:hypothetical protein